MPRFGTLSPASAALSDGAQAAKPCARLPQDRAARRGPARRPRQSGRDRRRGWRAAAADALRHLADGSCARDEVEAAWRWIEPILDGLGSEPWMPPKPYSAGSWGPSAAMALIERDGRTWHEDVA